MTRGSLHTRLLLLLLASGIAFLLVHAALVHWPLPQLLEWLEWGEPLEPWGWFSLALSTLLMLPLLLWLAAWQLAPLERLLRALEGATLSYRDGDYSSSIAAISGGGREIEALVRAHAELGAALREQRTQLAQRELLLDTLVQNTPVALLLCAMEHDQQDGPIVYANLSARQLLNEGRSLTRRQLGDVLINAPEALREALQTREDRLFSVDDPTQGTEERFHLSQRRLLMQGRPHRLILLRRMTRELSRQEVASWKRVIRVISHELNNSLAPISSLAHSGAELVRRGDAERAGQVFASIGARAGHLHSFLAGYASVAKLPTPQLQTVTWSGFVADLLAQGHASLEGPLPEVPARFDPAQVEQALINLIKNAHEAGGEAAAVTLAVQAQREQWRLIVSDRGPGMSETVLAQALLPFYSTKRSGTGLGLALAREIAEAHGGGIALANRDGGGLQVSLWLPRTSDRRL
ncbi:sensor histidine kinase [Pelomonas sp. V22]|uniref:sensor histidine kinase n=1 Tax=Pelomonas sp. V22 TaxID=2822139 RepID=UPI0024A8C396|nr:sensor histidine kinase [Pelomonas sp. V22]